MEDILTLVPYQLNGSHVNGGDGHLVLTGEVGEEIAEDWVGADELASYGCIELVSIDLISTSQINQASVKKV